MKPQTTARPRTPSLRSAAGRCVWGSVALRRNQRRTTMQLGNGTTRAYAYDANARLTTQIELSGATPLVTIVDSYDPVGNRIGRNLDGVVSTWTYDDLYRLTHQNKPGQVCTYVLDPVGNLEVMWEASANPKTFTFDAADRLVTMVEGSNTTTFTYTTFGALHTEHSRTGRVTNTYDGQDQLIKVQVSGLPGSVSTYTFDGDGMRRTAQEGNVQPTTMVWDGSDYLFLDGPSSDSLVLTLGGEIVACGAKDLLTDPLGTLVREISAGASLSGAFSFAPYGTPLSGSPTIPFRYIAAYGYFFDTKDLDYVRARELEKRLARWMQTDPLWPGERAFGYVGGSPIFLIDPFGLQVSNTAPRAAKMIKRDSDDATCINPEPPCRDLLKVDPKNVSQDLTTCLILAGQSTKEIEKCIIKYRKGVSDEMWDAMRRYIACVVASTTCVSTDGVPPTNPCVPPDGRCAFSCCYMEYLDCLLKCGGRKGASWGACVTGCGASFKQCVIKYPFNEAGHI